MRQSICDSDWIDDKQSVPQRSRLAKNAHRFRIAQMRMHIHKPDFAAEERRRFRASENCFGPPMVRDWPIHQARAVRKQEMLSNEVEVALRLFRSEQPPNDSPRHRQQRKGEARPIVAWMKQQLR